MANDFTGDSNCKALWSLESGALTADSIGTNTLTDNNTVGVDIVDFKEKSASGDFESTNNEFLSIIDANLDAGFPLKNGDTNKKISLVFWCMLESTSSSQTVFSKAEANKKSLLIQFASSDKTMRLFMGYNGGTSFEGVTISNSLVAGRWYHFGITYDDSTKAWKSRVWDDTLSSASSFSGTMSNNINIEDSLVEIGSWDSSNYWDGLLDEIVVFDDILTTDEIDEIRSGTYGGAPPTGNRRRRLLIAA